MIVTFIKRQFRLLAELTCHTIKRIVGHAKQKNGLNVSAKARVDEVEVEIVDAERLEVGRWRK